MYQIEDIIKNKMNLLYLTIGALLSFHIIRVLCKFYYRIKILRQIPGTLGNGMLQDSWTSYFHIKDGDQSLLDFFCNYTCQSGEGISCCWSFYVQFISLYKSELIKDVMATNVLDKGDNYKVFTDWIHKGLLTSTGKLWHKHRKIVTPAFHMQILEEFIDTFNRNAQKLTRTLSKANMNPINVHDVLKMYTFDTIMETAMGQTLDLDYLSSHPVCDAILDQGIISMHRMIRPHLFNEFIFKYSKYYKRHNYSCKILHDFSKKIIEDRSKELFNVTDDLNSNKAYKRKYVLIDSLLKRQKEVGDLSDSEIQDEVDTFVAGGIDTTTSALSFTLLLIGNHSEKQKLLHAELDEIFGNSDRPVNSSDLKSMIYLDCIIKESLRLYPPISMISKKIQEEMFIGKYRIPKDSYIMIPLFRLHRDPEQFPEPNDFIPERFLSENASKSPFAFLPFSAGPRNCIGQKFGLMEMKIALATVLRKFKIESILKNEEIKLKLCPTLTTEDDHFDIIFTER